MKSKKRDIVVNAGFGLAMAILAVIGFLYFRNVTAMTDFDRMVERSHVEILELEGLLSAMKDVENGEHIFTITGEERYLGSYRAASGEIDRHLATLKRLTENHPDLQNRVYRVEPLIRERLAEAGKTIDIRKREGYRGAYQREFVGQHKQLMEEIRRQLTETEKAVGQRLSQRKASKNLSARNMMLAFIAGTSLSFVLLFTIFILLRRDIAERKRAETALRFSEARYRALFQDNPTMIVTLDNALTMLTVNPICACLLGYTISELEGQSVLKLFHEDDRPAVAEQLRMILQNPGQVYRWQFRKVHKDGHLLWVEETAQAVDGLNGSLNILVVCQDITERNRAETALRKSEKRFSKIYNSVPALIAITTLKEGRFIDVNQTFLQTLGYQREEIVGRTAQELGLLEDDSVRATVMQAMEEQVSIQNLETRFNGKYGQTITGLYSAEFIDIDEERYVLSLVKDISGRKRAEEEIGRLNASLAARAADLEAVNKELEAFNYTVAHDLRNPLNVVGSYCQVIKELCGDRLDEQCRRYLQETYDGTLRMNRLIEALLQFSRLAHVELNRDEVDLSGMAREVAEELKGTEAARRVEMRIADGIIANGDAILLRLVLANLLGNAWKYTGKREEATIEFGVKEISGETVYFVRDNGAGFDNAVADKIFAPFQRLPGAEECRGFGIGLATVERIVRHHGGRVCAEGEPGKGATFWFTLP